MPGDRENSTGQLAGLIVGSLHEAGLLGAADIPRASAIVAEEIAVNKAMGDYWCSWCNLRAESVPGVHANDEAIGFAALGIEVHLKRVRRAASDEGIRLEIQARAGSFSARHETYVRIDDLIRFASELAEVGDARGEQTAELRSAANDALLELALPAGSATGRYLLRLQSGSGVAAELSGAFVVDAAILATLAREMTALIHDCWTKA
jgi:hypothetical protein